MAEFRMPAEWEPHEATWITWPQYNLDWPGKFAAIRWVYADLVKKLASSEPIHILVRDKETESRSRLALKNVGTDLDRVEFFRIKTDRGWNRDFGPIFVQNRRSRELTIPRFGFTGWAKYPNHELDGKVHEKVAKHLRIPLIAAEHRGRRIVLEGGAIDVNGRGTILTTEECLLDQKTQVRNPGLTRAEIEAVFAKYLGCTNTIWLGRGIAGDDTHGHVDDLCRFVSHDTIVLCRESNRKDANFRVLAENRERLRGARLEDGRHPTLVDLPMPEPVYFQGMRLPASYANFYIANRVVVVPTFNDLNDRIALGILAELFPGRTVQGIHALDLIWGLGTFHCLTQQQPKGAVVK